MTVYFYFLTLLLFYSICTFFIQQELPILVLKRGYSYANLWGSPGPHLTHRDTAGCVRWPG